MFARDIAKSLLRTLLPTDDIHVASDLLNEIEFGNHKNRIVVNPEIDPAVTRAADAGLPGLFGHFAGLRAKPGPDAAWPANATDFGQNTLVITIAPKEG